jgi:hypothetical protein
MTVSQLEEDIFIKEKAVQRKEAMARLSCTQNNVF